MSTAPEPKVVPVEPCVIPETVPAILWHENLQRAIGALVACVMASVPVATCALRSLSSLQNTPTVQAHEQAFLCNLVTGTWDATPSSGEAQTFLKGLRVAMILLHSVERSDLTDRVGSYGIDPISRLTEQHQFLRTYNRVFPLGSPEARGVCRALGVAYPLPYKTLYEAGICDTDELCVAFSFLWQILRYRR
jgi:hypothetical protein